MPKFRKKPVVIEAMQFTGDNIEAIWDWATAKDVYGPVDDDPNVYIWTLEGKMQCQPGDWIIRGIKNEMYPCKDDIFQATYEPEIDPCGCYRCTMERREPGLASFFEVNRMFLCPDCGNKRCPKATYHGEPCSGSNEPGQRGSRYPGGDEGLPIVVGTYERDDVLRLLGDPQGGGA